MLRECSTVVVMMATNTLGQHAHVWLLRHNALVCTETHTHGQVGARSDAIKSPGGRSRRQGVCYVQCRRLLYDWSAPSMVSNRSAGVETSPL